MKNPFVNASNLNADDEAGEDNLILIDEDRIQENIELLAEIKRKESHSEYSGSMIDQQEMIQEHGGTYRQGETRSQDQNFAPHQQVSSLYAGNDEDNFDNQSSSNRSNVAPSKPFIPYPKELQPALSTENFERLPASSWLNKLDRIRKTTFSKAEVENSTPKKTCQMLMINLLKKEHMHSTL